MKRDLKGRCMRDLCKKCQSRPVAINYKKEGRLYYRSVCDHCAKGFDHTRPTWKNSGYKKKTACDRCSFKGDDCQFDVYHADGNINNCKYENLKTVCANCQRLLHKLKQPWRRGDLTPDF
jgi:hypothetical protein